MSYTKLGFAVAGIAAAGLANAATFATFADPAVNGSTPLFHVAVGPQVVTGSWLGNGLTLQTPGISNTTYSNAHFTMAADPYTFIIAGVVAQMGAGEVDFMDSSNNAVFNLTFDSAILTFTGFGGASLVGDNVQFSGPGVGATTNGSFAFSFANQAFDGNGGFTATASFTSSADAVPEPASMTILGMGAVALIRRRRKN